MKQLIISNFILLLVAIVPAEAFVVSDTLVLVQGSIVDKESNAPLSATLTYEKLPYYDDIGIAKSSSSGHFRMHLVKSHTYNITVKANGYKTLNQELTVDQVSDNLEFAKDFKLEREKGEVEEMISLKNLIFARGRAIISSQSHVELDNLAKWLEDHPASDIQLEGHTDFEGNATANLKLSLSRVEAVKNYLIDKGIKKKRVLIKAFGGSEPLTRERTDEAKARNRRVEVRVISATNN